MKWFNKAIQISKSVLGKEFQYYLDLCEGLGELYFQMGEYDKAMELHKKALSDSLLLKASLSENHPVMASVYNNMALIYEKQQDYRTAIELYEKCRKIFSQVLGEKHPNTITVKSNLKNAALASGS
jgi:tetratricopeptide (TPR) repeat protein